MQKMNLFIFILFLLINKSFADDCGTITNCPDKNYCYYFCSSAGQRVPFCRSSPFDYPLGVIRLPHKLQEIPICLIYEDNNLYPSTITQRFSDAKNGNEYEVEIFNKSMLYEDISKAQYKVNCLCGLENEPCGCMVLVKFTNDPDRLPVNHRASYTYKSNPNNCNILCEDMNIHLNGHKEFQKKYSDGTLIRGYINDHVFDEHPNIEYDNSPGQFLINLTTIFKQGLAFLYGLPSEDCCLPIENNGIFWSKSLSIGKSPELTLDDICRFKKLYCPGLVPVEEQYVIGNGTISVSPNPNYEFTNINFKVAENGAEVDLTMFDNLGREVDMPLKSKFYLGGEYKITYSTAKLPIGIYWVIFKNGEVYQAITFIKLE